MQEDIFSKCTHNNIFKLLFDPLGLYVI